jgi:hypothetical protein
MVTDVLALEPPEPEQWQTLAGRLAPHFGVLWPAVEPVARQVHGDDRSRRVRLERLRQDWRRTRSALRGILGHHATSPLELIRAGAPVRFADIGVSTVQSRHALLLARFVRARYTILDLAAELGVLESWVDDLLATGNL